MLGVKSAGGTASELSRERNKLFLGSITCLLLNNLIALGQARLSSNGAPSFMLESVFKSANREILQTMTCKDFTDVGRKRCKWDVRKGCRTHMKTLKQLQVALNAQYSHEAWVSGTITELVYAKEISWSLSKRFHHSSIHFNHKYTERLIKFVKTFKGPGKATSCIRALCYLATACQAGSCLEWK